MATDRSEPYTCFTSGTDLSSLSKQNLTGGGSKHSSKHRSRFMLRTKVPKRAKQTSLFCRTTTFPHKRVSFGCSVGSAVAVERITRYYHLRSMRRSRARMRLLLTVQHAMVYQLLIGSWSRSADLHTAQDGTKFRHKAQVIFHNPPQAGF